jgi:hypothetical protein
MKVDPCSACHNDYFECSCYDRDYVEQPLEILSFGGGVQSTAMLLMIANGDLERPDMVIFADTGSELRETMDHIENNAKPFVEEVLKIPFVIARSHRGSLHEDYAKIGAIPLIGERSCTENFKILPVRREVRKIVGNKRGKVLARMWLGITTDEAHRKPEGKPDREPKWVECRYPLIDEKPTSRDECSLINELHGWSVVKSGCFCCPYQGTLQWAEIRDNHPDLWQICVDMEAKKFEIRKGKIGLFQCHPKEPRLEMLDDRLQVKGSSCDSGAGCFL